MADIAQATPPTPRRRGRGLNVVLKTTNVCNIACRFCSVGPAGKARMSLVDFERLAVAWDLASLNLTFHGGEPTALGAQWLDRACERMRRLPVRVTFSMQTNLYSLSDAFIEVARRHAIQIGSSIDPIGGQRITFDGRDTWQRWVQNYARMCAEGFRIGAIFVVTKAAVDRAQDVYEAAESLNQYSADPFGLQLNPVYPVGRASDPAHAAVNLSPREFGRFLVDIYRIWEAKVRRFKEAFVRE